MISKMRQNMMLESILLPDGRIDSYDRSRTLGQYSFEDWRSLLRLRESYFLDQRVLIPDSVISRKDQSTLLGSARSISSTLSLASVRNSMLLSLTPIDFPNGSIKREEQLSQYSLLKAPSNIEPSFSSMSLHTQFINKTTVKPVQSQATEISSFSPKSLSNLVLWLDASDNSTLFVDSLLTTYAKADGDLVGGLLDRSGNSRNALQATDTNKPLLKLNIKNGKPVIRFDGVDNWLRSTYGATIAQPITYLFVANMLSVAGSKSYYDGIVAGSRNQHFVDIAGVRHHIYAGSDITVAVYAAGWGVFTDIFNGAASKLYIGNTLQGTFNPNTQSVTGITIGANVTPSVYSNVDIGEMIVVNAVLSDSLRIQTIDYLNRKWGIS